ncbi:MAG: hypothetical protein HC919_08970 [Oscillatoriales cyanobacterium SM2_2_1]|nr:hypothetical protein [Oscillatoriales cyanobacterium SM2_2_1]
MSPHPEEHATLAAFLQQHRPVPPAPCSDLEARLMLQIEAMPHSTTAKKKWFRSGVAVVLAVVASSVLLWAWLGQTRSQEQLVLTAAEREELETFLLSSVSDAPTDDLLLSELRN